MKKSIEKAKRWAWISSTAHPADTVRVMDKPGKQAVVCQYDREYQRYILDGWHVVATYKAGKEV